MLPSISIVSTSYNTPLWIFDKHLNAIKNQNYPKNSIEHIVMDAGSTNGSIELAKIHGCTVVVRPDLLHQGLVRMSMGISKARGDIVLILEPDNIMVGNDWLQEMVKPFKERPNVVATYSMTNTFEMGMPMLTRYCALIGASDPTLLYLNKSEKLPQYKKHYDLGKILEERPGYLVVRFTHDSLPTLGDNGHMVRRRAIQKVNRNATTFLHIQAFADLLDIGFNTYGVVKNSIIHYSGSDIISLVSRRIIYKKSYYDVNLGKRSYYIFDYRTSKDKIHLFFYIIYSLTFIQPLIVSVRGYILVHDSAWFLHPVICFMTVITYAIAEVKRITKSKLG